ncbi:MAG: protein kinase [Thermoleophilia bacterium]
MLSVGTVLVDRYELQERLGVGGMGEVYRAFDRELERDVAIKSLLSHLANEDDLVQRFRREARTLARVRHPGIIALYDMLRLSDGSLYLVLEFVPGASLEQDLAGGRALPWARCADIAGQICGALAAAHAQDVIHRDIKPSNILIEPTGVVRVADFGIARLAGASQVTRGGMAIGTPGYWAPEQALGEATSPRTDIYAVGTVLFRACTGRMPFVPDEPGASVALLNVTRPVPDPREVDPGLPPDAAAVIMRAMARHPQDRWGNAVEMAAALRETLGAPSVTPLPAPVATPLPPTEIHPPPTPLLPPALPPTVVAPTPPPSTTPAPPVATDPAPVSTARTAHGPTRPARTEPLGRPPSAGRRSARAAIAVAAGLAVVGIVAGTLLGSSGGEGAPATAPDPERIRAGVGSIEVPAGWSSRAGGSLPGLSLDDATTARPADGGETPDRLVAGLSGAEGPTLLPEAFLERLAEPPASADRVVLGAAQAYRHDGLVVEGMAAPVTLYVVPTTAGVETVACVGGGAALEACADSAASLRLAGSARAIPLGPDADLSAAVAEPLAAFGTVRQRLRTRLAGADIPAGQAAAASDLAAAARTSAGALPSSSDGGPEAAGLVDPVRAALRAQAAAYGRMAAAARTADDAGFAAAADAVRAGEQRLDAALAAMRERGYPVTG